MDCNALKGVQSAAVGWVEQREANSPSQVPVGLALLDPPYGECELCHGEARYCGFCIRIFSIIRRMYQSCHESGNSFKKPILQRIGRGNV